MCACRKWDVRGAGLYSTSDVRPSYLNLKLCNVKNVRELCMDMSWNLPEQLGLYTSGRNRGAAIEADAIGEQQSKRTQSGSS